MCDWPKVLAVHVDIPQLVVIQLSETTGAMLNLRSETLYSEGDLHQILKQSPFVPFTGDEAMVLTVFNKLKGVNIPYPKVLAQHVDVPQLVVLQLSATTGAMLDTKREELCSEHDLHCVLKQAPFVPFKGDEKPILAVYAKLKAG